MNKEPSSLPPDRLWQPTTAKWFAVVLGASLVYSIVRYHVAGNVEWRHFPLFIHNKAISLAAVVFVACSYLINKIINWHNHKHIQDFQGWFFDQKSSMIVHPVTPFISRESYLGF